MTMTTTELITAVKRHAHENYEKDGWDYVVETMTDEDIAELIGKASTVAGALRKVKAVITLLHERREDIQSTIW